MQYEYKIEATRSHSDAGFNTSILLMEMMSIAQWNSEKEEWELIQVITPRDVNCLFGVFKRPKK